MMEEGQNQGKIAQQRIKLEELMEREDDRISALPDYLLHEILSRLPSTEDAIRTSTLSKRWEHVWTWVPTLILTPPTPSCFLNPNSTLDFPLLTDKTLTQCRQLKLKKFEVHTLYDIRFESQLNNWIRFAISCNVEEVNLEFCGMQHEFILEDRLFFINSCFTDMRLERCKLNPSGAISWENLRSLCLFQVNVDQNLIVNILAGSPLLETLVLEACKWPYITSESESESDIIGIRAPNLSPTQCRRSKLKKFEVSTGFSIQFQSQINNWILHAIRCNVKELSLELWNLSEGYKLMLDPIFFTSSCFTELKLHGCMLDPIRAISWKSLRSLCISCYQSLDEDLIENILSGSPVLETLVLADCYGYRRINIISESVKNFVLIGYNNPNGESEADIIEINAPNTLSLTIEGTFLCKQLLLNVSSVVKAYLNYNCPKLDYRQKKPKEVEQEMLKGCIMNLCHVKELELGFLSSKVLSCLQANGFVSPSNVKLTGRM